MPHNNEGNMLIYAVLLGFSFAALKDAEAKTTFVDCGGSQKSIAVNSGSVKPDPIVYPGNVSITSMMKVLKDLPTSGLKMHLKLTKLDPFVMPVPCLKNIGSCSYDVCDMIQNNRDQFCPMFPPSVKCGCPLKASTYNLKNAIVAMPDFGEIFAKVLQGNYNGTITFEDSNKKTEVGCIAVTFQIKSATKMYRNAFI